jgi:hypothetical protein
MFVEDLAVVCVTMCGKPLYHAGKLALIDSMDVSV